MTYNSLQEVFDSGTANMTYVVNNVKHDDDKVQVSCPSWLTFLGVSVSDAYVSGNSFISFDNSTEHIQMNRRDCAMYYLLTEEGTILNTYNFFRIRWEGYSRYNNTASSYSQKWEVVFVDNGDIQLKFVNIPSSNTDGTKKLVTSNEEYTFNMSSNTPYIAFKYNLSDQTFTQSYEILNLIPDSKYLIRSGSNIYTIQNDTLVDLGVVSVTSSLFESDGFDVIDKDLLLSVISPELLTYNSIVPVKTKLTLRGSPHPKTLIVKVNNLNGDSGFGIKEIYGNFEGAIKLAISLNNGLNYYKFFEGNWVLCNSDDDGMLLSDATQLETEDWYEICQTNLSCYLKLIFYDLNQSLTSLHIEI